MCVCVIFQVLVKDLDPKQDAKCYLLYYFLREFVDTFFKFYLKVATSETMNLEMFLSWFLILKNQFSKFSILKFLCY